MTEQQSRGYAPSCRHCGKPPEQDGDHSCPCPHSDNECPDHPLSERTRLIREQQRTGGGEVTAVMVSGDTEPSASWRYASPTRTSTSTSTTESEQR